MTSYGDPHQLPPVPPGEPPSPGSALPKILIGLLAGGGLAAVLLIAVGAFLYLTDDDDSSGERTATAPASTDANLATTVTSTPPATTATTSAPTTTLVTTVAPTTTTTSSTTTEPAPPTTVEFRCPAGFCAHFESVEVVDGELIIEWTAHGYVPSTDNFHAHFFYDIYDPDQVGTNYVQMGAETQGDWELTDDQPFSTAGTAVSLANAPPGVRRICVVPADSGHGVTNPENAECVTVTEVLADR